MEGNMNRATLLKNPSIVIDLECDKGTGEKELCDDVLDDEHFGDDDCIVTLDTAFDSSQNSMVLNVGGDGEGMAVELIEASGLDLKIQDVVSLSSSVGNARSSELTICDEIDDTTACFAEDVELPSDSGFLLPSYQSISDPLVFGYTDALNSNHNKRLSQSPNGGRINWQPIVPLVDIAKKPGFLSRNSKVAEQREGEEDDCIVIDTDQKTTPDIIVVDELADIDQNMKSLAVESSTGNGVPYSASANAGFATAKLLGPSFQRLSSLKRTASPQNDESRREKLARTDNADVDNNLAFNANSAEISSSYPSVVICGSDDNHSCTNTEWDAAHSVVLSSLNSSFICGEEFPGNEHHSSASIQLSNNAFLEDTTQSFGVTAESVSDNGSRLSDIFAETPGNTSPFDGGEGQVLPNNCEGESLPGSEFIAGKLCVINYPNGLCVRGSWDGDCFHVSSSSVLKPREASPKPEGAVVVSPVDSVVLRFSDDVIVTGVWDGHHFNVATTVREGRHTVGETTQKVEDSETSISSDVQKLPEIKKGLVEYPLSDSEDGLSNHEEQIQIQFTSCNSSPMSHDFRHHGVKVSRSTSTTSGTNLATTSVERKNVETMTTQCFYGNRPATIDVTSKRSHVTPKPRPDNRESGADVCLVQSFQEEVVHISSEEEDNVDDETPDNTVNLNRTHSGFVSKMVPEPSEQRISRSVTKDHNRRERSTKGLLIRPTKFILGVHTLIPRECYLTPKDLMIIMKQGSFKFDVQKFKLIEVSDGRVVFLVPSRVSKTLGDAMNLSPSTVSGFKDGNSRLTVCIDELTPMKLLIRILQQIPEASESETRPPRESWKDTLLRLLKKHAPKRVASFSRPRHLRKPFFARYRSPKLRDNCFPIHPGVYDTAANDAFLHDYNSGYNMTAPIQVSGFSGAVLKLFTYPPPPAARGIAVTNEDLFCLNAGEYVNDVIIDFYLKYLFNERLSDGDRLRSHVFSSFFYGHLVSISSTSKDDSTNLSLAQQRHQKVRTWTRHVDLFSKDFIIVPINENYHWFLAIICFPGLRTETIHNKSNAVASQVKLAKPDNDLPNSTSNKEKITEEEQTAGLSAGSVNKPEPDPVAAAVTEVKKNCCILIFDSLQGDNRWDVACMLREYLQVEWDLKKAATEGDRSFSKDMMKGCRPQCPQQPNYSDCGLYLLQYVEAFFTKPLKDFSLPIKYLKDWFDGSEARAKRSELRELILELKAELNPDLEYDPVADGCCNDIAPEEDLRADL